MQMTTTLTSDISGKINANIPKYLPKVYQDYEVSKRFQRRTETWMRDKQFEIENAIIALEAFKDQ